MDFSFTEEQQLLEDTVRRFTAKDYAFEKRRVQVADLLRGKRYFDFRGGKR